jgi:parallel beta-helix repeat protein
MVNASERRPARLGWAAAWAGLICTGGLLVVLQHVKEGDQSPGRTAAPAAAGRTLFVSATAPRNGLGSAARPFATIQQAADVAQPGDTVRVGPGTYSGGFQTVRSGTAERPIRFSGMHAQVIRGRGPARVIELRNDYLELSGFEVVGGTAGIRLWGANHVRVVNNTVRDALGECVRVKNQSSYNEVAYNDIANCGRRNFNLARDRKNGEGVYVGTAPEQLGELPSDGPDRSDHNWIHDNTIHTPAECVDVKEFSSAALVEHNMCTGVQDPDSGSFSARGDGVTFRGNTVVGGAGAGIRLGGDEAGQGVHAVVVDNELDHPRGYGVKIMRTPQGEICGNGLGEPGAGPSNLGTPDPAAACP